MPLDGMTELPAYASLAYAKSLAHVGQPLFVPEWGTHVVLRPVPGEAGRLDAVGPYPICCLTPKADLRAGFAALRMAGAVSVVLVADPLHGPDPAALKRAFPVCRPFKTHWLVDRRAGSAEPSKHHQDRMRRGGRHATGLRVSLRDAAWRAEWGRLYGGLVARRCITGMQAFTPAAFEALTDVGDDQLLAVAATNGSEVLAMQIWVCQAGRGYSHLTATSQAGYRLGASYVVYETALRLLSECCVLDLGGGAGLGDDPADTLAMFKRGFANRSVAAYLCGKVLDPALYAALAAGRNGAFFPAYRQGSE